MQNSPERFCALMSEVTCEACPIRIVDEQTWRTGLRPGVTPFEAAVHVSDEVNAVHEETLAELEGCVDPVYEEYGSGSDLDAPSQAELRADDAVGALSATILPIGDGISVEGLGENADGTRPAATIVRALGGCVEKQFAGDCVLDSVFEQMIEAMPGLRDRALGAAVLNTIARHGNVGEVRQMAAQIQEVLEDIYDRLELTGRAPESSDFSKLPEVTARAYLMRVAELLEQGAFRLNWHS